MSAPTVLFEFPPGVSSPEEYFVASIKQQYWRDPKLWDPIQFYATIDENTNIEDIIQTIRLLIGKPSLPNVVTLLAAIMKRTEELHPNFKYPVDILATLVYRSPTQTMTILWLFGKDSELSKLDIHSEQGKTWLENFIVSRAAESVKSSYIGVIILESLRKTVLHQQLLEMMVEAALEVGNFQPICYAYYRKHRFQPKFVKNIYTKAFQSVKNTFTYGRLLRLLDGQQLLLSMLYPSSYWHFCDDQPLDLFTEDQKDLYKGRMYQCINRLEEILLITFCDRDDMLAQEVALCKFMSHPMTMAQFRDVKPLDMDPTNPDMVTILSFSKPSVKLGRGLFTPEGSDIVIPVILKAEKSSLHAPTRATRREFYMAAYTLNRIYTETHGGFAPVLGTFDCNCSTETPFEQSGWICPDTSIEETDTWSYVAYEEVQDSVSFDELIVANVRHPWFADMTHEFVWETLVAIFVITLLNCLYAHEKFQFTHYDLHTGNILVQKLRAVHDFSYHFPVYKGSVYEMPIDVVIRTQFRPVIIDYGRSFVSILEIPCGDPLSMFGAAEVSDIVPNPMVDFQLLINSFELGITKAGFQRNPASGSVYNFIEKIRRAADLPRKIIHHTALIEDSEEREHIREMMERGLQPLPDYTISHVCPEGSSAMRRLVVDMLSLYASFFSDNYRVPDLNARDLLMQRYNLVGKVRYQWAYLQMYDRPPDTVATLITWMSQVMDFTSKLRITNNTDNIILLNWCTSIIQACLCSHEFQTLWKHPKSMGQANVMRKKRFLEMLTKLSSDVSQNYLHSIIEKLLPV